MYICSVGRDYNLLCVECVGGVFSMWHTVFVVHSVCGCGMWCQRCNVVCGACDCGCGVWGLLVGIVLVVCSVCGCGTCCCVS